MIGCGETQAYIHVYSYTYLGSEFSNNGTWDLHVQNVVSTGNEVYTILHVLAIMIYACRLLLLLEGFRSIILRGG